MMRFRMFNNLVVLRSPIQKFRLPTLETWGLTSKIQDKHFLMLDYDKVDIDVVQDDVRNLQRNFNIGTCLLRISSLYNYKKTEVGSYHVYSFYKYDFEQVKRLLEHTRCDDSFKTGYRYQARCWVLRLGEKLDSNNHLVKPFTLLHSVLNQKHNGRQKIACKGLLELFELLDNIKLKQCFKRLDNTSIKDLEFIKYVTK